MAHSQPQPPERKRPDLHGLLAHPIFLSDNGTRPPDLEIDDNGVATEDNTPAQESYPDWPLDHSGRARFYLGGFLGLRSLTREPNARYYYMFAQRAKDTVHDIDWINDLRGNWDDNISYNQFRKAIILQEPMFLELTIRVLLHCECALFDAIRNGRYAGHHFDVYDHMKIIPACYNINDFNRSTLAALRSRVANYDNAVLSYAGQRSPHLLELLTQGNCVTRRTARAIRWKTLQLTHLNTLAGIEIGDVRGRPGRQRLGRKNATTVEAVELDDIHVHQN